MLPYKNSALPLEERLDDLIPRMTLQELILQTDQYSLDPALAPNPGGKGYLLDLEKADELFQGCSVGVVATWKLTTAQRNDLQRHAIEQTRLGIPFLFCEEALHGLSARDATSFPQQIGLAASFHPELGREMGHAIATEARAKGFHELFAPVMDLMRDPRFGRTEEGYGEDTFLAAQFARETVFGLQGDDLKAPDAVASEPKHYAAYGSPVAGLNCAPCAMSRHEVFTDSLPVFEAAVKDAGATDIMCSYTAVGHTPIAMDHEILTEVLRDQWGMKGFVRSDMTAVSRLYDWFYITETEDEAIRLGMEAGVDLQLHDFPHETWQGGIRRLVESGKMDRAVLEQSARRVLRTKMLLGLFDNPYTDVSLEPQRVHCREHLDLAQRIARESFVLLKNENGLLPLSEDLHTIAVIGPSAGQANLGDYTPHGKGGVSLVEGLRDRLPNAKILYEPGCGFMGNVARAIPAEMLRDENGEPGLTGRYYASRTPEGEPVMVRRDQRVDFNWSIFRPDGTIFSEKFPSNIYSVVWTGTLISPDSFQGYLGFDGEDSMRLYVDGQLVLDCWGENRFADRLIPFSFEAGREYAIRMEFTNDQQAALLKLGYRRSLEDFGPAIEAAKQAQVAIVSVGDSGETSGENFDRASLDLSGNQLELVKAIYATGTPVVLVLQSGRPVSCTWEHKHVGAILECWFPGEQGGYAMADTLLGRSNPSGRLPMSFPRTVGQVPCHYTRRPGGGRKYIDISWVPLYPFGYGLSYTSFQLRGLTLSAREILPGETITATITVANTGDRAGVAVPQLYLRDWVSSTVKPERYLAGFARVELEPGQEKTVEIPIGPRSMRTLDRNFQWNVEPGKFTVYLAEDAETMRFEETFFVK